MKQEKPTMTLTDRPYAAAIQVKLQSFFFLFRGFDSIASSFTSGKNIVNGLKKANDLFTLASTPWGSTSRSCLSAAFVVGAEIRE
jgi:hypothetical protein